MNKQPMPHVERGRLGARRRWGPRRIVRLDQVDPAVANIIRAILQAQENAAADRDTSATASGTEVTHGGVDSTA